MLASLTLAYGCTDVVPMPVNDVLNSTVTDSFVDSDGDGFSDETEINGTPGTDPIDSTDNPASVRDSDGDGCSDYDEINFPNFCDNDPNTSSCYAAYYHPEFRFGFDLPSNAELRDTTINEGLIVYSLIWVIILDGRILSVSVRIVQDPLQALEDWVNGKNDINAAIGHTILEAFPFTLASGVEAYFTSAIGPLGSAVYLVDVIANGYAYELSAAFPESLPSDSASAFMIAILDSLCVD